MSISISLHVLAALIWVGGMFFAYMALRPAAAKSLEPPERLGLWVQVFKFFFLWVWISIITLLASGYWMIFNVFGGMANPGTHIHIMHGCGIVMVLVYLWIFFSPYRRLRQAVIIKDYPEGASQLARIRKMVGLNLLIGLFTTVIASGGRYL